MHVVRGPQRCHGCQDEKVLPVSFFATKERHFATYVAYINT